MFARNMSRGARCGDTVRVHFVCHGQEGTIIDFSIGRDPLQFTIGEHQTLPAIEYAVIGMPPNSCKSVTIQADETFGPLRGKTLLFDLLLLDVMDFPHAHTYKFQAIITNLEAKGSLNDLINQRQATAHPSILIAVPVFNRPKITQLSLAQIQRFKTASCHVQVYNDHSTEYDNAFLRPYADEVIRLPMKMGIHALRLYQLKEFLKTDFDCIYLTDNDAIHDPCFVTVLKALYEMGDRSLPVCLYNSRFHMHPSGIVYKGNGVLLKKTVPGISVLFDRKMVEKIVVILNSVGPRHDEFGWDYRVLSYLDVPCITSETSYVEHFGGDGLHNDDYERDRALHPSIYLQERRRDILNYLTE